MFYNLIFGISLCCLIRSSSGIPYLCLTEFTVKTGIPYLCLQSSLIILVDGESVAAGYVTLGSLENVPEEKLF